MGTSAMPKLYFFTQADNQVPKKPKKAKKTQSAKEKYRLSNWPDYNKTLISKGFVTLWLSEDTLANWYYQGPRAAGGQFRYSDECIQAALALKAVFRLAFRQTQGLIQSILATMKMNLQMPSYTQLCRRQAKVVTFTAPVPCEDGIVEALHIVIDSTGVKVYGEGDGVARAVEGKKARSR
ncbi:transposase [Runella sp. SP2]|uniref:transposase n=1 Tax=Runella sp. SP2 TaxID=2268026 RepID=UPI001E50F04C|nr:transposase [Runella sp. SP2]